MRLIQTLAIALFYILMNTTDAAAQGESAAGDQVPMSTNVSGETLHNYLLYLPKDYADSNKKFPLVLFLHGAGERGDNKLDLVKVHGPPKLIAAGRQFPFIVVSPQCKTNGWWEAAELSDLLDHVESQYRVDKDRIYVTGLSMGGFGTWALAACEPERFAAIAPVCGGGNPIATRYTKPIQAAIWTFHGGKDSVVPLSESEEMVKALKERKVDVKLTVYADASHDSWTKTYNNEELYKWLLEHKRP